MSLLHNWAAQYYTWASTVFGIWFEKTFLVTHDYVVYLDYILFSTAFAICRILRFSHSNLDLSHPPQARLCGICRRVDYGSLACLGSPQGPWRNPYRADFGLLRDVLRREENCDLCHVLIDSIRRQGLLERQDEQHVKARSRPFYTTVVDAGNARGLTTTSTHHMTIVLENKHGDRQVFRFQACAYPIPKAQEPAERPLPRHPDSQRTFSGRLLSGEQCRLHLYREWYQLCVSQHGSRCGATKYTELAEAFAQPILVLDVRDSGRPMEARAGCRYVALSYVWGKTKNFQLTRENFPSLMKDGLGSDIPQTIRDAISVVDAVGEQYLWVDSLCIFQDDAVSKQQQIAQMATVFSNALFTIVAAGGENAHIGLWPRLKTSRLQQQVLRIGRHTLITLLDQSFKASEDDWDSNKKKNRSKYAWASRGWTFQEVLCSRRVMAFTPVQAYWHCQERDWLEETALEHAAPCAYNLHISGEGDEIHFWAPAFNQFFRDVDAMLPRPFTSTENMLDCYAKLVTEYTKRYLAMPQDGLNAFTGAISIIKSLTGEEFFWGLPESEFGWALAWCATNWNYSSRDSPSTDRSLQITGSPAVRRRQLPSWSWTSWYLDDEIEKFVYFNRFEATMPYFSIPEISFYREGRNGELVLVKQRTKKDFGIPRLYFGYVSYRHGNEWYSSEDWKGEPISIDGAITTGTPKDFDDSGVIQFWTSMATLVVHRYFSEGKREYVAMSKGYLQRYCRRRHPVGMPCYCKVGEAISVIEMGSTDHIPVGEHERLGYVSESYRRLSRPSIDDGDENGDLLVLDFCVVSREAGRRDFLNVLVLERGEDGVWYRLGCTTMAEMTWVHILNRRWILIRLK